MFIGRELQKSGLRSAFLHQLDREKMQKVAQAKLSKLGLMTIQNINLAVETLKGGQRQGVAMARAAAFMRGAKGALKGTNMMDTSWLFDQSQEFRAKV